MLSFPSLTHLLNRHRPFLGAAKRRWVVYPGSEERTPAATYLPDTLNRVTGFWVEGDHQALWRTERLRIDGGLVQHAATEALEFVNVKLHEGHLYTGSAVLKLEPRAQTLKPMRGSAPRLSNAALACSGLGNRYFGHFLSDDLPLNILAREFAPPIRTERALGPHQLQYRALLDVHSQSYVSAHIDRLHTFIDFAQNRYKQERFQTIRSRLLQLHPPPSAPAPGAFILRGSGGVLRRLVNEHAMAEYLANLGFVIVDPERMSVAEISQALSGVQVVVGVEGSHLLHGLWTIAERGAMLVLQPPFRFNNVGKNYTDCLGQRYAFVIGHPQEGGFVIQLDEFKTVLDMVMG